jgi:hypothetical protein
MEERQFNLTQLLKGSLEHLSKSVVYQSMEDSVISPSTVQASLVDSHMSFEEGFSNRHEFVQNMPPEGTHFWRYMHFPDLSPHSVFFSERRAGNLIDMVIQDTDSRREAPISRFHGVHAMIILTPSPKI